MFLQDFCSGVHTHATIKHSELEPDSIEEIGNTWLVPILAISGPFDENTVIASNEIPASFIAVTSITSTIKIRITIIGGSVCAGHSGEEEGSWGDEEGASGDV